MDDERGTPEDELEQPDADTQPDAEQDEGEPADVDAAEDSPDQSPAPNVIAQAEYTRATQTNAAIRKELGLDKSAPQAEVIAALQALRDGASSDEADEDEEELSERERLAIQRATAAEIRVQSAVYGEAFANDGLALVNELRGTDDVEAIFTSLAAFVQTHGGGTPAVEASDEDESDEDAGEAGDEGGFDTSEGDRAPRSTESTPRTRRESGVVGAIRAAFDAAGVTRPTRR